MAVTYRIEPDEGIVYLTTTGESSFAEWRDAMLSALSDPQYRRGMGFLSDRLAETDVPDPEFARPAAQFLMQHEEEPAGSWWAALSNNTAVYGDAAHVLDPVGEDRRHGDGLQGLRAGAAVAARTCGLKT